MIIIFKKLFIVFSFITVLFTSINTSAYGFGFKRNKDHTTPEIGMYKNILENTNSYYVGNSSEKTLYLTFDAGYDNGNMAKILDILKEKEVYATFFLTGDFFVHEDLIKRMVDENHIVANHTENHLDITKLDKETLREELDKVNQRYFIITNKQMIKYFRPPEGTFTKESLMLVKEFSYKTFFWSIAYNDWNTDKQKGNDYGYHQVMDNLHNGAIILLHSVSTDNVNCLAKIIDESRNLGYTFKNLDEFKP